MSLIELKKHTRTAFEAILNSYSILFFLNNRWMALAVLAASFLNFYAGLSGLLAALVAVLVALVLGFNPNQLRTGIYSFNALITGIGLGTFFDPGIVFFVVLILASLLTLILSVAMGGWMFKYGLPFLSLPFIFTFWIIHLPATEYANLGLTYRNIFWINELYAIGGSSLLNLYQQVESMQLGVMLETYLRSLSSIFFQDNIIAGSMVAIGLVAASRIFFSLSVVGFITAYLFAVFVGSEAASITYYNIGANFIMVAIAVGGFFIIPSKASFLWTVVLVPITSIVLLFFTKLLAFAQLPVFSLPYTAVTVLFVHFLQQRGSARTLVLTPLQQYSPELNLYSYQNNKERLSRFWYIPLQFPFWGEWNITQGYNGAFTHKDEWGNALDFMILDQEGKSYSGNGLDCEQYYCFGKPVTAPADGVVADCIDGIDDNDAGQVNTVQNWGNSIVIQHIDGLYSQLSHLRKNSIKVKKGEFVKAGDIIAQCGNSGRSPYPHLHFQMQTQPHIGARTIAYPIGYFNEKKYGQPHHSLQQYRIPEAASRVANLQPSLFLYHAFNILPDTSLCFTWTDQNSTTRTEHWDAYTDAYNYKYLYSRETGAVAYYTCDKLMFYFISFYGEKQSLLYHFFGAAYKILLSDNEEALTDRLPVHLGNTSALLRILNDFIAPFTSLLSVDYSQLPTQLDHTFETRNAELSTGMTVSFTGKLISKSSHSIAIDHRGIHSFSVTNSKTTLHAQRVF